MLTLLRNDSTLPSLIAEVNRLAHDVSLGAEGAWAHAALRPAADVLETDAGFEVALDLPGIDPKALQIQVEDDVLTVQGERRRAEPPKDGSVHRAERPAGTFYRSFSLPASVDGARVEAKYDAGVLTVTLPKREEAKPRTIQVKVA
ncbi:MAG TPA: Hsp20/alpha crystallin family protein [Anaeromyxobacteraceae bacterium]|nr:Hsp20/alpha crystallin family protein [Anaeromyxobacteraceae bacterium]